MDFVLLSQNMTNYEIQELKSQTHLSSRFVYLCNILLFFNFVL